MRVLDRPSENELVFEMINIDVSFANALRRILLADVPTVAIEYVYMWNNTSIIHDEVLAHRLGLVPLNVDARMFEEFHPDDDPTDDNTLVFSLTIACPKSESKKKDTDDDNEEEGDAEDYVTANPELQEAAAAAAAHAKTAVETPGRPFTKHVYSRDLKWIPQGDQEERFPNGISPVHDDILLAKLRPGQQIELEAHAHVGTGQDHAKYSPVATACYRLMPHIELVKPVYDELAEELVNLYEPGVFDLVETDAEDPPETRCKARLVNPYACTMSRNYMRVPQLAESIKMSRIPNHFIFSVESVGMQKPAVLVAEALRVLQKKCTRLSELADASGLSAVDDDDEDDEEMEEE